MEGPYMPMTTRGVAAALISEAAQAHRDPTSAPMNSAVITFCVASPTFTEIHMRTSRTLFAAALPAPALDTLMPVIADLLSRAQSTWGVGPHDAALEVILLLRTMVLGPQRPCASSSSVRTEVVARLDLWRRGDLRELARRAKVLAF